MVVIIAPTSRLTDIDYYKIADYLTNNYGDFTINDIYKCLNTNIFHNAPANIFFYKNEFPLLRKNVKKQLLLLPAPLNAKEIHKSLKILKNLWITKLFNIEIMTAGRKKFFKKNTRKTRKIKNYF